VRESGHPVPRFGADEPDRESVPLSGVQSRREAVEFGLSSNGPSLGSWLSTQTDWKSALTDSPL
jgi:hypothetical protein